MMRASTLTVPERDRWSLRHRFPLLATGTALLLGGLYVLTAARDQVLFGDPAVYIGLARSIVEGHGYVFNFGPHTLYPPGFPLILALPVRAGAGVWALQVGVGVLGGAGIWVVAHYLRSRGHWTTALLIAAMTGISASYYALATGEIRSEAAYVVLTYGALAMAERGGTRDSSRRWRGWVAAALLPPLIVLTRVVGVAFAVALLLTSLQLLWLRSRGRRSAAEYLLGALTGFLAFGGWRIWTAVHSGGSGTGNPGASSYFRALVLVDPHQPDLGVATVWTIALRLMNTLLVQGTHVAELLTGIPWLRPLWFSPLLLVTALAVVVGLWRELRRPIPLAGWYALAYGAVIVLWPYDEGTRYLLPILPLLLSFTLDGGRQILRGLTADPRGWWWAIAAVALLAVPAVFVEAAVTDGVSLQVLASAAAWVLVLAMSLMAGAFPRRIPSPDRARAVALTVWLSSYFLLNLSGILTLATANVTGERTLEHYRDLVPALTWIQEQTARNDVIMARSSTGIHFYTGRRVAFLPVTTDRRKLREALATEKPDYLLIEEPHEYPYYRPTPPQVLALIRGLLPDGALRYVHDYGNGQIYRVVDLEGPSP